MRQLNVRALEVQTESLVRSCRRLREENQELLDKQNQLLRERTDLIEKNRQAIDKLNSIIARLTQLGGQSEAGV